MSSEKLNEDALLQNKLDKIRHTFIVLSGKGGVGKSTVAVNLALSLSLRGMRTGILDVDIHGPSVPKLLGLTGMRVGVSGEEIIPLELYGHIKVVSMGLLISGNEQAVIWRGPLKASVIRQFVQNVAWGELDALVVDCPPGTGDEPLSIAQLVGKKASAIIVTTPQLVATIDVEKCITFCRQLELPIAGIIENMSGFVCPHCGKEVDIFSSGGGQNLAMAYNIPFLGSIPLDPDIVKSGDAEQPYIYLYSQTKTAQRFDEIVDRIVSSKEIWKSDTEVKANDISNSAPIDVKTKDDNQEKGGNGFMRFAVPTYQGKLCAHFGHCEAFAIIDTDNNGNIIKEVFENPPPHEPGVLPKWLSEKGVNCVIAGGMGSRAQQLFAQQGVKVVTGAQGEYPRDVVEQYLKGTLQIGANTCDH
ncbi:MAG TPA: iron-sulfur cluster carrier protein MrpORP [Syntrophorhabdaceae bacterium]|nr:iron-sulfur cluster carrier protein MrpORP [Syntrophorhabdaceae bacterium]HQH44276.1 iron-sulfur cluster carrier protein MrpORP [Syntrophorhabdaceae bacterium]HQK47465.1 iron-sulfur cluster carrier protein MrpORP [Syntrophorhabdaceae bacterium]HRV23533.1 iron-sulfur cluster carrier protein MrpORP [Syntrophorhabdaceae bacterium]